MPDLIDVVTERVRRIVDPLLIKLRHEIYGAGNTFGQYFAETKIPPEIPRHTDEVNGLTGEGIAGRGTIWTAEKQLAASNSIIEKAAPTESGGGIYISSGHLYLGTYTPSGLANKRNIVGGYSQFDVASQDKLYAGVSADGFKFEAEGDFVRINFLESLPDDVSDGANGLVLGNDNKLYLGNIASDGGGAKVPQRFGWFFDGYVDVGEEIGPVYNLNTPYELAEINAYVREPGLGNISFKLEATDQFNPYFQSLGITPSWETLGTFNIPAGDKVWRTAFTPTIKPASRNTSGDFLSGNPAPSGDYGTWLRLTTLSGGGAEGVTITFMINTR